MIIHCKGASNCTVGGKAVKIAVVLGSQRYAVVEYSEENEVHM